MVVRSAEVPVARIGLQKGQPGLAPGEGWGGVLHQFANHLAAR